ncbi:MAG TPA: hypothetical protein VF765_13270 [Polyangiaceae bacterium]
MTIASRDGRDARPDADVCESIDGGDELLDRWLSKPPRRHALSSRPPPADAREPPEPIGDSVADAWFR